MIGDFDSPLPTRTSDLVPLLFMLGMWLRLDKTMGGSIYGGHRQNYGKPCSLEMNFLSHSCSCIKDIFVC